MYTPAPTPTIDPAAADAATTVGTVFGMAFVFVFLAAIAVGPTVICYLMAKSRGRNVGLAIVGGLLFGIFAIIYYAIAGDTVESRVRKEEEARRRLARA